MAHRSQQDRQASPAPVEVTSKPPQPLPQAVAPPTAETQHHGPWILSKGVWLATIALAIAWGLGLGALAWLTANPITLNYQQIATSQFVVSGTVTDVQAGRVDVDREWKRGEPLEEVVVGNLGQTGAELGKRYLLPLVAAEARAGEFQINESLIGDGKPLIYPATPEAIAQLETILKALRAEQAAQ